MVMFIYREDKYKPDTDRKNIAEIHVEKHRNGPTGKIDLYFNPKKSASLPLKEEISGKCDFLFTIHKSQNIHFFITDEDGNDYKMNISDFYFVIRNYL